MVQKGVVDDASAAACCIVGSRITASSGTSGGSGRPLPDAGDSCGDFEGHHFPLPFRPFPWPLPPELAALCALLATQVGAFGNLPQLEAP